MRSPTKYRVSRNLIDIGKSMNLTGQLVLSQLLKFIDKQKMLDLMGCGCYVRSK